MARTKPEREQSAFPDGLSCEICLVAEDPADMLHFDVEVVPERPIRTAHICRKCVAAILMAARTAVYGDPPSPEDENNDQS